VPFKDVLKIVIESHGRPKIPEEGATDEIIRLIRLCWQQDPDKRPSITDVVAMLEHIKETFEGS
jgi:hypothetical protein